MPRLLRLLLMVMLIYEKHDGQVGKAQADGTQDEALVVGFADDAAASGATVKVLVAGLLDYPSLSIQVMCIF